MSTSLEDTLATIITGLSAFAALSPVPVIRPYKFAEQDLVPGTGYQGVLIAVLEEDDQHPDLAMRGGGVSAQATITSVAETFDAAWALAEIIRTNNTNPGTGLVAFTGAVAGSDITIYGVTADSRKRGHMPYQDGGDEGFFYVIQPYQIDHTEIA